MFPPPPPFYVANTWQTEGREVPDLLTCWGQLKIIHAFLFSRIGLKRGNWALSHCTFDLASFLCAQNWDQVSTPSINEWNWPKYFLEDENCDRIKGEQTASRGFKHRLCSPVLCCAESCSTLCDPMYCSSPGSSVHGISQARILEQVTISFSMGSSPRDLELMSLGFPSLQTNSLLLSHPGFKFLRHHSVGQVPSPFYVSVSIPVKWKWKTAFTSQDY